MARFVVSHPAAVPNRAMRLLVLVGIACVGAAATARAAARSVLDADRRRRRTETPAQLASDDPRKATA
jgi:hypothetical protein